MHIIKNNQQITHLNTLKLNSVAHYFIELVDISGLAIICDFIKNRQCDFFILGGGSNLILPEEYHGLVIHNKLAGINFITDKNGEVTVRAMAGVIWDKFVEYTIANGWYGLENLSLIPGTVGAAPIQNIGAYGVEVGDFVEYVEVYDILTGEFKQIKNTDCKFSYRNSIFKKMSNYIIVAVVFKLSRTPRLNDKYGDVAKCLVEIQSPTPLDLRNCVINIRRNKLPDPDIIPNVGSFFHNPILLNIEIDKLKSDYENLPLFVVDDKHSKVSAGWLIDNLGLKGYRENNIGIYDRQALVLINYGQANQTEILAFAKNIQDKVKAKYGIELNIEPIIIR